MKREEILITLEVLEKFMSKSLTKKRSAYSNKKITYGDMKRILATCRASIK